MNLRILMTGYNFLWRLRQICRKPWSIAPNNLTNMSLLFAFVIKLLKQFNTKAMGSLYFYQACNVSNMVQVVRHKSSSFLLIFCLKFHAQFRNMFLFFVTSWFCYSTTFNHVSSTVCEGKYYIQTISLILFQLVKWMFA